MTSDLTPSAAPNNIDDLRAKNPEPTHPTRDPITQPASLIWPHKADTGAWWEDQAGQEYIQKHFSVKLIAKYFRTRSPVSSSADVDGWRARELMAPLFMGDDEELQALIRDHMVLPNEIFTLDVYKTWNQQDRAWVDMRLHSTTAASVSLTTPSLAWPHHTRPTPFVDFLGTFAVPLSRSGCRATTSRTPPVGIYVSWYNTRYVCM